MSAKARSSHGRPFFRAEAHRGARSILQRSHERLASQRRLLNRNGRISKSSRGFKGWTRTEISRQKRPFTGGTGARVRTFPRQSNQEGLKNSARSFTALGRNRKRTSRHRPAPRTVSAETTRQRQAFNNRAGAKVRTFPRQEVQKGPRGSVRSFENPRTSKGRSSRLPFQGRRNFSGSLRGGKKGFAGKFSRK